MAEADASEIVKRTEVETLPLLRAICPGDRLVMLGSCFAQYMGERMATSGYEVMVNPLGTLFNPFSIGATVRAALHTEDTVFPIFPADGEWRCWWANTRIKAPTPNELELLLRNRYQELGEALRNADHLVMTLGTNVCYKTRFPNPANGTDNSGENEALKVASHATGQGKDDASYIVVTNCQRQPDRLFLEWRATVNEIVEDMTNTVEELLKVNPKLQIILTVSPYRYHKYGYHGSQLSKSTLLLAEDEIIKRFPKTCCYFPAYEILLDELRDYRFYASDGHHPAQEAVDGIWEKFASSNCRV